MCSKDFLKVSTIKGPKRHIRFILAIFAKKDLVEGERVVVAAKMLCPESSGSAINPFSSSVTFLYPLKTSENQRFLTFSRGIEM